PSGTKRDKKFSPSPIPSSACWSGKNESLRALSRYQPNDRAHQQYSHPSHDSAHELRLAAEQPAKAFAGEIAVERQRLDREYPAGVKTDRQVERAAAQERVAQYETDDEKADKAGNRRRRIEIRREAEKEKPKPGERVEDARHELFRRLEEVRCGVKQIR